MALVVPIAVYLVVSSFILSVTAPADKARVFNVRIAAVGTNDGNRITDVDVSKAFHMESNIFYNGDRDLWVEFDLSANASQVEIDINGDVQTVSGGAQRLRLNRNVDSLQSYEIAFRFESEAHWHRFNVHDASAHDSPEIINSHFDLQLFSAKVNFGLDSYEGELVELGGNLQLPEYENNHIAIGNPFNQSSFRGIFEGNGFSISGLRLTGAPAFFHEVKDSVVRNLTLSGDIVAQQNASGFANIFNNSIIINSANKVNVTTTAPKAAGFFGTVTGNSILIGCLNFAEISAPSSSGIAAEINATSFTSINSGNLGNLSGDSVSGLAAILDETSSIDIYNFISGGALNGTQSNVVVPLAGNSNVNIVGGYRIVGDCIEDFSGNTLDIQTALRTINDTNDSLRNDPVFAELLDFITVAAIIEAFFGGHQEAALVTVRFMSGTSVIESVQARFGENVAFIRPSFSGNNYLLGWSTKQSFAPDELRYGDIGHFVVHENLVKLENYEYFIDFYAVLVTQSEISGNPDIRLPAVTLQTDKHTSPTIRRFLPRAMPITLMHDESCALFLTTAFKDGYRFYGWASSQENAELGIRVAMQVITESTRATLWAIWVLDCK